MKEPVHISLEPLGREIEVSAGSPLQDALFPHGVEFPCGGQGRCRGCLIRILKGELAGDANGYGGLSDDEIAVGWRRACCCRADADVTLELAQWETPILGDDSTFTFQPREGYGIAIDLGTTTVVGQLLDLSNGNVLAVRSALNAQARHGADIMTRVEFARTAEGRGTLTGLIRSQLDRLVADLAVAAKIDSSSIARVTLVGNTVMHHLFCDLDLETLARVPFESPHQNAVDHRADQLDWGTAPDCSICFLPCLGGFVGSDVLAGIVATGMHRSAELVALVDLGTNGEIAVGNRDGILCASTAAGPAFEGARISMGMRAATGAISRVEASAGRAVCHVLGNETPRGICGSGLVDAIAAGLDLEQIRTTGRLANDGADWRLAESVALTQTDVREVQLAKGAISAGLRILLARHSMDGSRLDRLHIAGAFGNYLDLSSARRIGLIDHPMELMRASGNTALLGAKIALFDDDPDIWAEVRRSIQHIALGSDPEFMETYVSEMTFPATERLSKSEPSVPALENSIV